MDTLHGIKLSAKEPSPPPPSTSGQTNQTKEKEMRKCNEIRTDGEDCDQMIVMMLERVSSRW